MKRSVHLNLAGVLILLANPWAISQPPCPIGDDGFNPGCCQLPTPNLPNFPPVQMQASYTCIGNCNPSNPLTSGVTLGAPQYFLCDYAVAHISFTLPGGSGFTGLLLLKYARTWRELNLAGTATQVWRFLVNGDLGLQGPGITTINCPIPPCALPPHNLPVHWVGHIDYACSNISTQPVFAALSLNHLVGCLFHAPFSARPLGGASGHVNISYHLVGPAPFAFLPILEPQGAVIADAVRSSRLIWSPFSYNCQGEADVQGGTLVTQSSDCLCSPILPIIGPYRHQDLNGSVCCNGALFPFGSVPLPGTPFPTGFVAQTLGSYTPAPGGFFWPGSRELTIYVGLLHYANPCGPSTTFPLHIVTGVGTSRVPGQNFQNPLGLCGPTILPIPTTWIDLQNVLILATATATTGPLPGIGSLFGSTIVWGLDTPVP